MTASIMAAFREAFSSFRSGKIRTMMAVTTTSIAMLIFAGFLMVSYNLSVGLDLFRSASKIEALLANDADGIRVAADIEKISGVESTRYYTKIEAMDYFRKKQGVALAEGISQALGAIPFPAFIEVHLAADRVDPAPIADDIKKITGVDEVLYGRQAVERLARIARIVKTLVWWLGGIMSFFILLIVVNGVRATVHARRGDILILRLVGATDGYIRAPFLVEGAATGLLGSFIGLGLLYAFSLYIRKSIPYFEIEFITPQMAIAAIVFAVALGALGGVIAVREVE